MEGEKRVAAKHPKKLNMKRCLLIGLSLVVISCSHGSKKEIIVNLLKEKIGGRLPFDEVRIADIEGGTGVIVDQFNCYWISSDNQVYCVNGASKNVLYNKVTRSCDCIDAPIKAGYIEINSIAK